MPARIKIEDLPVLEDLKDEEVRGIFGGSPKAKQWLVTNFAGSIDGMPTNNATGSEELLTMKEDDILAVL